VSLHRAAWERSLAAVFAQVERPLHQPPRRWSVMHTHSCRQPAYCPGTMRTRRGPIRHCAHGVYALSVALARRWRQPWCREPRDRPSQPGAVLQTRVQRDLIWPRNAEYDTARTAWNARVDRRPAHRPLCRRRRRHRRDRLSARSAALDGSAQRWTQHRW